MNKKEKKNRIWVVLAGIAWSAGLLIAGSESPHMPWVNIMGALVFFAASLMLGKILPDLEISPGAETKQTRSARPVPARDRVEKERGVLPGYALGVMLKG
ncbi:hypothetical protein [Desulfospira joergensenii]|uniref:hypothetical protein n=1 Tax=Desulfospira joergensenii TaxID=53329 RepID=UPI0003B6A3C6|nr:hypothetical protein [Desulfospira joergensenii]